MHGVLQSTNRFARLSVAGLLAGGESAPWQLPIESVQRFSGDFNKVRDELDHAGQQADVYLVCQTEAEARRVDDIFAETLTAVFAYFVVRSGKWMNVQV